MVTLSASGVARLALTFEELAKLPDEVLCEMLEAEADVVEPEISRQAEAMLRGPYYEGAVAKAVYHKPPRRSVKSQNMHMYISFKGTQHGESIARIAYINEYGKRNQPPRPFIKTAIEKAADAAIEAAADVLENYIEKSAVQLKYLLS